MKKNIIKPLKTLKGSEFKNSFSVISVYSVVL